MSTPKGKRLLKGPRTRNRIKGLASTATASGEEEGKRFWRSWKITNEKVEFMDSSVQDTTRSGKDESPKYHGRANSQPRTRYGALIMAQMDDKFASRFAHYLASRGLMRPAKKEACISWPGLGLLIKDGGGGLLPSSFSRGGGGGAF